MSGSMTLRAIVSIAFVYHLSERYATICSDVNCLILSQLTIPKIVTKGRLLSRVEVPSDQQILDEPF
ncbi:hypothetical protein D3C84_946070 [compost metagenome]